MHTIVKVLKPLSREFSIVLLLPKVHVEGTHGINLIDKKFTTCCEQSALAIVSYSLSSTRLKSKNCQLRSSFFDQSLNEFHVSLHDVTRRCARNTSTSPCISCRLRELLLSGIGYHHAGLDAHDRHLVEDLFTQGELLVLREWPPRRVITTYCCCFYSSTCAFALSSARGFMVDFPADRDRAF